MINEFQTDHKPETSITRSEVLGWLMADPEEVFAAQEKDRDEHKKCLQRIEELEESIEKRGKLIAAIVALRNELRN